jgi:hypothetical protein
MGVAVPATAQSIHQRENRQEQRIRQGERTGQLTPQEAGRLQHREMKLHRTEARMRWRNGGRLNERQRYRLRQMEQRDGHAIRRLKHNGRSY